MKKIHLSALAFLFCIISNHEVSAQSVQPLPSVAVNWDTLTVTKTKTGERRQVFQAPTETLDNMEMHVTTLNPGELAHQPHQHPEEELTIVKEGTVEVLVNGKYIRVGPGSVVFQAANQLHSIKNVGTTVAVYYAMKWRTGKTLPATKAN